MSDRVIAWLRTVVPGAWGALLLWVAGNAILPAPLVEYLSNPATVALVVGLSIGAWKAFLGWLEPKMPPWLTRVLLGSNQTPTYDNVDGREPDLEDIDGETFDEATPVG